MGHLSRGVICRLSCFECNMTPPNNSIGHFLIESPTTSNARPRATHLTTDKGCRSHELRITPRITHNLINIGALNLCRELADLLLPLGVWLIVYLPQCPTNTATRPQSVKNETYEGAVPPMFNFLWLFDLQLCTCYKIVT